MSDIFTVIADPTRRALLIALTSKSQTVGELVALTGEGQPTVSKHLKTLRDAGLVTVAAAGQARVYSIDRSSFTDIASFLNQVAPSADAASKPSKAKASAKQEPTDVVEKTLTDAAVTLAGWINEGATWLNAKVQETVAENELTPERLGKDLGRKLADAKLQATDAAFDAESALRAEIGDLSSRLGVQAADLRGLLDQLIEDGKDKVGEKLTEAKSAMLNKRKAAEAPTAEAEPEL
jgi:DNA-binding transcriptional ArsR family regulator